MQTFTRLVQWEVISTSATQPRSAIGAVRQSRQSARELKEAHWCIRAFSQQQQDLAINPPHDTRLCSTCNTATSHVCSAVRDRVETGSCCFLFCVVRGCCFHTLCEDTRRSLSHPKSTASTRHHNRPPSLSTCITQPNTLRCHLVRKGNTTSDGSHLNWYVSPPGRGESCPRHGRGL